jgi:4-hydroxy-2-oxoheptanedioate aldolase
MRHSRIRAKLAKNEPALCTALCFADPAIYELASVMGMDGLWLDMEHHGHSVETASQLMRAARVGKSDIVARPGKGEFMRMGRLLEVGAQAIMYPRCESAEEAAEVVRWAKFAPIGKRGFDGANADAVYCGYSMTDYIAHANRETVIIVQLEEQKAVDQAEAIAAVPGVDVLMLGPADFSILEGFAGQFDHAGFPPALKKIASAARNTGKHWARPVASPEQAKESLEMGARLLFYGADLLFIRRGLQKMQSDFGEVGFSFG